MFHIDPHHRHFGYDSGNDIMMPDFQFFAAPHNGCKRKYHHRHNTADLKSSVGEDSWSATLDVQHFAPSEISIKTVGSQIVIEGQHEEKQDEHGVVSRHFVRKYTLPEGHEAEDVKSSLSSDGVLTIAAPKKKLLEPGERMIPIQLTGPAHKTIKDTPAKP